MKGPVRLLPILLALAPLPAVAQQTEKPVPAAPQPVLLDWGGQFRLNAAPTNVGHDALKQAEAAEQARQQEKSGTAPSSPTVAALGPQDPARTRWSNRSIASDDTRLNVRAPVTTGPVSVGASFGKYRAVPTTREISANDARVSLGVAF